MGFLDIFKIHFRKELEETGREPPAEKEINGIISVADRLFHTEKKEENLMTLEAEQVQRLCLIIGKFIQREGKDEDLTMLANIFMYLRSHTIDKLDYLRRIKGTSANIIAESKECKKYDKKIAAVAREKDPKKRREIIEDLRVIITVMGDIRKRAEDIDKAINVLRANNDNMRLILKGGYKEKGFKQFKPISELLKNIREFYFRATTIKVIQEITGIIKSLDSNLAKQNRRINSLKRKIKKIEKREKQVIALMRRYKVAA